MTWRGATTTGDRIFACLPYLMPLMEGVLFGEYLFRQFPILGQLCMPLIVLRFQIYNSIPFASLIIFMALFLGVVRNQNIAHFIRFNAMQAILLDIVLFLCSLILPIFIKALPIGLVGETLFNMVFIATVAACGYAVVQSLSGRYAEMPVVSEAVYMQVR
ncbi:Tic20 family protein [[Phormidium] sp. ETS-05]|uniref:Tic20 family protein n=1 Tax=[Phormidium] sp. ETS-05 TaxID=222819 RepID=UPI0018EF3440|nr:Tic20 family protein [[Phormidium] sp. ETS-05]